MYGALDISTSGMIAQRTRHDGFAANIANYNAFSVDAAGNVDPYRRRQVLVAPGNPTATTAEGRRMGVHVSEIQINQNAVRPKFDPTNPYASKSGPDTGYILMPDIDLVTEQVDDLEAKRAYEANLVAAEATKSMMAQALRLIA